MDKDEVILLSLFSGHPVIFAAGYTEEYPFDYGIPLLTANSLLGRPRRDTGLVSLYIYSSLTYNRGLLNNESLG